MYEPIRTKSIHSTMAGGTDFPHRTREEELDIQLAGHLAALLAVTDELRATAPSQDLDDAAERLAEQVTRLREGRPPARSAVAADPARLATLHRRAHALEHAGRLRFPAGLLLGVEEAALGLVGGVEFGVQG
ncbi:SCO4983 family protein, partial [Streptomyces nigra]